MEHKSLCYGDLPALMLEALGQMYDPREIPSLAYMIADECWGLSKGQLLLGRQQTMPVDHQSEFFKVLEELFE